MSLPSTQVSFPGNGIKLSTYGNASIEGNVAILTPAEKYQGGAVYMGPGAVTNAFTSQFTFLLDETPPQGGADGIAWIVRGTPPVNGTDGKPDLSFYGGKAPSLTVHFDSYPNVPVWNEPNANFVAVYRDQNLVFSENLCSSVLPAGTVWNDGTPWNVWMNQFNKTFTVSYSKQTNPPATPQLICNNVNVSDILKGSPASYTGFIGLTGEAYNRQLVSSYSSTTCVYPGSVLNGTDCSCPGGSFYPTSSTYFSSSCYPPVAAESSGLGVGAIVGIVVGVLALLGLIAGLAVYFVRRNRKYGAVEVSGNYPVQAAKPEAPMTQVKLMEETQVPVTRVAQMPATNLIVGQSVASDVTSVDSPIPFASQHLDYSDRSYSVRPTVRTDSEANRINGSTMTCIRTFVPELEDEIVVNKGDKVLVTTVFEDGWCVVENANSHAHGLVPLAVLALI
jgi:hypothetical protein